MSEKILIMPINKFKKEQIKKLKKIAPEYDFIIKTRENVKIKDMVKPEVIYGIPSREQLKKAANLKWLQLESAGADNFINKEIYPNKNIILTNSSGVYGLPIAEHVLSMILAFNKNIPQYVKQKQDKTWQGLEKNRDLYNSVVGIIGLGDIGNQIAKKSHALGSKVLAVKNTPENKPEYVEKLWGQEGINTLLQKSDYVVLALPLTEQTMGIIDEKRLKLMKPDAFLVNIGRGKLIEQEALIKALKKDWIAGAGLDVTNPEPLPESSPLWDLKNVILTPHVSGLSPSNIERKFDIFRENLKRYINGDNLINKVDFSRQY
ncbi:MAG: D-2-hydroxyacid dehydrogenase [Bacillota bacterium]